MATAVIMFDVGKLEKQGSSAYGHTAWRIFWSLVKPHDMSPGSRLYCGDHSTGAGPAYTIAVHSDDVGSVEWVHGRLTSDPVYQAVAGHEGVYLRGAPPEQELLLAGVIADNGAYENRQADWAHVAHGDLLLAGKESQLQTLTVSGRRLVRVIELRNAKHEAVSLAGLERTEVECFNGMIHFELLWTREPSIQANDKVLLELVVEVGGLRLECVVVCLGISRRGLTRSSEMSLWVIGAVRILDAEPQ